MPCLPNLLLLQRLERVQRSVRVPRASAMVVRRWMTALVTLVVMAMPASAASVVEVSSIGLSRADQQLSLEFSLRVQLSKTVEDALRKGVPMYFVAQASLMRERWYWRDERVARVSRQWRLAYQPLTNTWRVGIGALSQNFNSLSEALATLTRTSGWVLAELKDLDGDSRYLVDFAFRLDTTQLPAPLTVGLTAGSEWQLSLERTLRVD